VALATRVRCAVLRRSANGTAFLRLCRDDCAFVRHARRDIADAKICAAALIFETALPRSASHGTRKISTAFMLTVACFATAFAMLLTALRLGVSSERHRRSASKASAAPRQLYQSGRLRRRSVARLCWLAR